MSPLFLRSEITQPISRAELAEALEWLLCGRLKINGADEKYSAETLECSVAGLQFVQESINGDETKKW